MNTANLHRLLETAGAPGDEGEIQRPVADLYAPLADHAYTDRHGNLYLAINPDVPLRVMLAAHGDQIGCMIKRIDKGGFRPARPLGPP